MNISFETAKTLKEMGFPKPKPETGQLWYIGDELAGCFYDGFNGKFGLLCPGLGVDFCMVSDPVFCPTATDILREMEGYGISLQYDSTASAYSWVCASAEWSSPNMISAYDETNPHEAAAQAWIKWKKA